MVALVALAPQASAEIYTNAASHYSFQYPDSWTTSTGNGLDTILLGPSSGGFAPNIAAQHESEPTAQNTSVWLLGYVRNSFESLKSQLAVTEVQAPRTFTTASGRLAGDYIFEQQSGGMTIRQRQVFWVSAFHQLTFFLTLSDKQSSYDSHEPDWSQAVDSFAVEGEPAATPLATGAILLVVGAAVLTVATVVLVLHRKKARTPVPPPATAPATGYASLGAVGPSSPPPWPGLGLVNGTTGAGLVTASAPVLESPAPPAATQAPPPVPPAQGVRPGQGAQAPAKSVRCPKCGQVFAAPPTRPVQVKCPACGTPGLLK
jgi:hypothetical protein